MEGYLLLHGKGAGPEYPACAMNEVAKIMEKDGKTFDYIAHSWAINRVFKTPFEDSIEDVKAGIKRLQDRGVTRLHIVGHSIGANIALFYATRAVNFTSLVLLAPAHNTHLEKFNQWSLWSRRKAHDLVMAGNDELADFIDTNMLETYIISCKPSAYFSYLNPRGDSVMTKNVRLIKEPINVFVASGTADFTQVEVGRLIYDPILKKPSSKFLQNGDGHLDLPPKTYPIWTQWCEGLPD